MGPNGVLNIGGGTLSADTTLKLYASGSNGQINFISDVILGGNSAKILAANSITILDDVVVTVGNIADENPASVYTNHANYTGFGGNGSTTGTFAGSGANDPLPLDDAPDFDDDPRPATPNASPRPTSPPRPASRTPIAHPRPPAAPHVTSAGRHHGDFRAGSSNPPRNVINVRDSDQLLSLLDGTPDANGKIAVPARNNTPDHGNSSRTNAAGPSGHGGGGHVFATTNRLF